MASDPGLNFESWTMPSSGTFTRRFDFSRHVEAYTLNDRFSDISDGNITVSGIFARASELLVVDNTNHSNDKGTVVRVLRGQIPVAHFVLRRLDDKWDSKSNLRPGILDGAEYFLDHTLVPNWDYLTQPYRNPDWIYGAASIFEGLGSELAQEVQGLYREAVVNTGTFVIRFRSQDTVAIAWNATAATVAAAINDLGFQQVWRDAAVNSGVFRLNFQGDQTIDLAWNVSAATMKTQLEALASITTVNVTGTGSIADPWTIAFVSPLGNQEDLTISNSTCNGNLFHLNSPTEVNVEGDGSAAFPWTITFINPEGDVSAITIPTSTLNGNLFVTTITTGGSLSPAPWTPSWNPVTGLFHNTYSSFQMVTGPTYLGALWSLEVNPDTPIYPTDYGGAQVIVNVDSGGFYRAELPVYSPTAQPVLFLIEDMSENRIATLVHTTAVATWEVLKIPDILLPVGIDEIIFRLAQVTNGNPGPIYISTEHAVLAPGFEAAPLGYILGQIHDALQEQGIFTWVTRTFSDTLDSLGVAWDQNLSWGVSHGQSLLQLHEYANKWNYRWGFEWSVTNSRWEWHAYNPGSTLGDVTNIALTGRDGGIGSGTISTQMPNATHYQADGEGGEWGEYTDTTMLPTWGRLDKFYGNAQGLASADLLELATRLVAFSSTRTDGLMLEYQNPDDLPWLAYKKGQTVMVNIEPKYPKTRMPVMAIVASKEAKQDPKYNVHLNGIVYDSEAAIYENLRRLTRKFEALPFNRAGGAENPSIGGGSAPTLVIAALNSSAETKGKADFICTGAGDQVTFAEALLQLGGLGGRILLSEGTFTFSGVCTVNQSVRFEGMGKGATRITLSAAANSSVFGLTGTFQVDFANLTIDGAKSIQTSGTGACISFPANIASTVHIDNCDFYNAKGDGLSWNRMAGHLWLSRTKIHACDGHGVNVFFEGSFHITDCDIYSNGGRGIACDAAREFLVKGNRIFSNTSYGIGGGGIFQTDGQVIEGNYIYSNGNHGIYINGHAYIIADNWSTGNTGAGIGCDGVDNPPNIVGNHCNLNTTSGIIASGSGGGNIVGNHAYHNGQHGILISSGNDWAIKGNVCDSNSRTTHNTYDGIQNNADNCAIVGNTIRQDGFGNKHRYGINITATADATYVVTNDARASQTANYIDAGTNTVNVVNGPGGFGDNY